VIDELADIMATAPKGFAKTLQRLVQLSRAAGIYVIAATQRPSVDVVQGVLKANFPARLTYRLASTTDSHVILGQKGAESLLAYGDALFVAPGAKTQRVHGPFVSAQQIHNLVQAWL
jgi:S-DNA-T family DNA segregation ATPase FtsK/SpoIIIE